MQLREELPSLCATLSPAGIVTSSTVSRASVATPESTSLLQGATERSDARAVPWLAAAVIVAATSVVVGVVWDISWHMTIGRDTFWTPAHMAMYFGGVVGGTASGIVALKTTFRGSDSERATSVRFWGFRAPLGAWVSIWGSFAMLISAPFDNWWHNAYGLDVEILSPPHVVLAAGMVALALGAMLVMLAAQNRASDESAARWAVSYGYVAGCVLSFLAIMTTEYSFRTMQHTSLFYRISCFVFPLILVAAGNTARHRWGATLVAGSYTLIRLVMLWILPLFPATPRLGPIYQDITHMVPMDFPLLLLVPAIAMDLVRQRMGTTHVWRLALAQGATFFATFVPAQWLLAIFLLSPASHNRIFATNTFPYDMPKTSGYFKGLWVTFDPTPTAFATGMVVAFGLALVSALIGAAWFKGLRQVKR